MSDTPHILLVDDDRAFRTVYSGLLRASGYTVHEADDRPSARAAFGAREHDAIILDLMLPPDGSAQGGLDLLAEFLAERPDAKIIIVSGAGDTRFMVQAVRRGAFDFITKPADPDVVLVVLQRAVTRKRLEARITRLEDDLLKRAPSDAMIGESPSFLRAVELAERVAPTDLPVLITGEHGTGKELLARTVHTHSRRASRPFIPINCGALPPTLLESTLFGHVKGAFTGATSDRPGLFTQAHTGTLFLDEIGDTPPELQVKLLRAIEYGEILPVGADRPQHVDVRLISATNKDLHAMQAAEEFREDLYWRINGATLHLPPLRERVEDIPLLATFFLNKAVNLSPSGRPQHLSDEARAALIRHTWPGNLRELRHEMQRAVVLAGDRPTLQPADFGFTSRPAPSRSPHVDARDMTLQEKIEELEAREIRAALAECDHNRTHAARRLGLSRQGLLNKMERYGLA